MEAIAKPCARIQRSNLIAWGLPPLMFVDPTDYVHIHQGDELEIADLHHGLRSGDRVALVNRTKHLNIMVVHDLSPRQVDILLHGGLLNRIRAKG
ncbi:MAG: hypothetical protein HYZ68_00840 [Chloroflexi bacterium]|nr:hypothetical protein [Chloroflexota bacterium]